MSWNQMFSVVPLHQPVRPEVPEKFRCPTRSTFGSIIKLTLVSSLCYLIVTVLHVKDIAILNTARQLTEPVTEGTSQAWRSTASGD